MDSARDALDVPRHVLPSVDPFMHDLGKRLCEVMNYADVESTWSPVPRGFLIRFGGLSFGVISEGSFDQPDFSTSVFKAGLDGALVGSGVPDGVIDKIPATPRNSGPNGSPNHGVVTRRESVVSDRSESGDGVGVAGTP